MIELLTTDTTGAKIVNTLRKKSDVPAETIEFDVRKAFEVLRSVGALNE